VSATDPGPAAAKLGDLIGEHGRLEVAYRLALAGNGSPAERWQPVLHALHQAVGLASGLAAGHTSLPGTSDLGELRPCSRCEGRTAMRIYGQPWHHSCWMAAGCPVDPAPDQTTEPAENTAENATASPTEEAPKDDSPDAVKGRYKRRQAVRDADRTEGWTVDPDEERADWSRACRAKAIMPGASDQDCLDALDAWHRRVLAWDDKTGRRPVAFKSSPGATGLLMYELLAARNGSMVQPEPLRDKLVLSISGPNGRGAEKHTGTSWSFTAPEVPAPAGQGWTELDVTAQYLGAAASVECGDGEPDHLDEIQPDWLPRLVKVPGYVQLAAAPDLSPLRPAARGSFAALDAGVWLPIPALKYLAVDKREHPVTVEVARAVVWPAGRTRGDVRFGRRLAAWATRIRTARADLAADAAAGEPGAALALKVLKRTYAAFLGGMLKSDNDNDKGTLRPDWADMLVCTAGVNALRALDKIAADPFAGLKDAFYFAHDPAAGPFHPDGLPIEDKPGKWHVNRSGKITPDMADAHARNRPGLIQRHARKAAHDRQKEQG
jgi:hypothetical protein